MSDEALNGHASADELDPSEWLQSADAQAFLGCGSQRLSKLAIAGRIERRQSSGGAWAYSLASMRAWAEETADADDDAGSTKVKTSTPELVLLLRDAQKHAAESFKMVHEPSRKLIEFYKDELVRANTRIAALEAAHDANVKAREAALSEEHVRRLAEREAERRGARWDAAFEVLKQTGPAILMQIVETIGESTDPGRSAAYRLMQRLTPARLAELLRTDALDENERTLITEILREQAERAKAKAEAEAAEAEGNSTGPAERIARSGVKAGEPTSDGDEKPAPLTGPGRAQKSRKRGGKVRHGNV